MAGGRDRKKKKMRLVLADDHTLVRESLREFLGRLDDEVVISEAADLAGAEAAAAESPPPDLIILDLVMPGMDGLAGLRRMRERYPDIPIVVLSGSVNRGDIASAFSCGACGFVPKTMGVKALLGALRLVLAGEKYIPPLMLDPGGEPAREAENPLADRLAILTPREQEVLNLLMRGLPNKAIARELGGAEITVKVHLKSIFRKLDVANRAQAIIAAQKLGWKEEK